MPAIPRRYWAIRTDKDNRDLILSELRRGKFRQGWGYAKDQDLRSIQAAISEGKSLSETQDKAWRNLRMLSTSHDSMHLQDWIVVPNLPQQGKFIVAEIKDEYAYDPLKLSEEQNINGLDQDYGHVLPVRLLTEKGINKYNLNVDAGIRKTLKAQGRMWNLDKYGPQLASLVEMYANGEDLASAASGEARLQTAWEKAVSIATDALKKELEPALDSHFQAAEWEEPIKLMFERLYPGANVEWVAGSSEQGADVVVKLRNPFDDGSPWLMVIQVKNYQNEIGTSVLGQLKQAHERYSRDGKVLCLAVITTAKTKAQDWTEKAGKLSKELGVPIELLLHEKTLEIITESFAADWGDAKG